MDARTAAMSSMVLAAFASVPAVALVDRKRSLERAARPIDVAEILSQRQILTAVAGDDSTTVDTVRPTFCVVRDRNTDCWRPAA